MSHGRDIYENGLTFYGKSIFVVILERFRRNIPIPTLTLRPEYSILRNWYRFRRCRIYMSHEHDLYECESAFYKKSIFAVILERFLRNISIPTLTPRPTYSSVRNWFHFRRFRIYYMSYAHDSYEYESTFYGKSILMVISERFRRNVPISTLIPRPEYSNLRNWYRCRRFCIYHTCHMDKIYMSMSQLFVRNPFSRLFWKDSFGIFRFRLWFRGPNT